MATGAFHSKVISNYGSSNPQNPACLTSTMSFSSMRPRTALQVTIKNSYWPAGLWKSMISLLFSENDDFFFFPLSHDGRAAVSGVWEDPGRRSSSADLHLQRSRQCSACCWPHTYLLSDTGKHIHTADERSLEYVQHNKYGTYKNARNPSSGSSLPGLATQRQ